MMSLLRVLATNLLALPLIASPLNAQSQRIEYRLTYSGTGDHRVEKTVTGITPDRVTTDGHDSHPRAIRTELGRGVRHRTSRYLTDVFDKAFLVESCYFPPARVTAWPRAGFGMQACRAASDLRLPLAAPVRPAGGEFCQFATKRV